MPIKKLILFVLLQGATCLFAQTRKIDSLKAVLINAKEDSFKFRTYYNIAGEYWIGLKDTIDYANTFRYEDSAFSLAKKLNYQYGIFDCLMCYGNVYAYQENYLESRKYYTRAIEAAKLLGDKKFIGDTYFEIADNFFVYGNNAKNYIINFPISLEFYYKALKNYEETGAKYKMAKTWFFIARTYSWQHFFSLGKGTPIEMERAVLNALKYYKLCKETTKADMAGCDFVLGRAKYYQADYTKAKYLFLSSLEYDKDSSDKATLANTYINLGRVYKAMGDSCLSKQNKTGAFPAFKEAIRYLHLSLKLYSALERHGMTALCYLYMGDIERNLNKYAESKEHLLKAIFYTEKLKAGGSYQEIYESLAKLESAKGNYKQALDYFAQHMAYKEKLTAENNLSQLLSNKAQYEFDKKEDSLNQKQFITETKLKAEKKQKYFYWAGLCLLALLSMLVFLNFRNQKRINRLAADAYAKERAELELQSLRAQLNPHFIFNCINSIDAFIHSNDKYNATIYLNKFAKLLRNILDSSKLATVSFARDIDTLKLYIELEELRHENKFGTLYSIDEELLNNDYKVPALIIQPFVENAILHGLKNREDDHGLLEIRIRKANDKIEYIIKDNGIGRGAAALIAQNKESSYGMQISFDRIRLFNREDEPSATITDLQKDGIACGTEVQVLLNMI